MTEPNAFDETRLDRYLAGECSPAEDGAVRRLMAERPALASLIQALEGARLASPQTAKAHLPVAGNVDADWAAVAARAGITAPVTAPRSSAKAFSAHPRAISRRRWTAPALMAGAGFAVAALIYGSNRSTPSDVESQNFATVIGQHKVIKLADGSSVTLGPASTLRTTPDGRHATLVGEGFFEVARTSSRPFVVKTSSAFTTVLGTSFDIRAYPTDGETRVAVLDGRVQVNRGNVVSAGEVAHVDPSGRARVIRDNVALYQQWTTGRLDFVDTPISTVVQDLSRWYDVDVRVATPALANEHFTASFGGESLDYILHTLSVTLGARVDRQGRTVVLSRP